jgi:hypothetical protein
MTNLRRVVQEFENGELVPDEIPWGMIATDSSHVRQATISSLRQAQVAGMLFPMMRVMGPLFVRVASEGVGSVGAGVISAL